MFRGHIRDSKAFPTADQKVILIEAGVPERAIYTDDIEAAKKSLRKGNRLVVVGFRNLGSDREEILSEIEAVHKRGCAVMDAKTKRLSTGKYCKNLVAEAVTDLANERRGPRRKGRKGQMPWDQVSPIWFNKSLTDAQVLAAVNKGRRGLARLSHTTIWRHFGKRNGNVGRPSKK